MNSKILCHVGGTILWISKFCETINSLGRISAYHLDDEAQLWYQLAKKRRKFIYLVTQSVYPIWTNRDWQFFLMIWPNSNKRDQREYQNQFRKFLNCVGGLQPSYQVGCFISGLKEHRKCWGPSSKPTTLSATRDLLVSMKPSTIRNIDYFNWSNYITYNLLIKIKALTTFS